MQLSRLLARGCDIDKPRNLAKSVTVEYRGFKEAGAICTGFFYHHLSGCGIGWG